jgi:hypothetical protein
MNATQKRSLGVFTMIVGMGLASSAAMPAFGQTVDDTTATVSVNSILTLSGLTDDFTLVGDPSTTAEDTGAVSMNVLTNNLTGYTVSVQAEADALTGATTGNGDTIPIGNLKTKNTSGTYTGLSDTAALTVASSDAKTLELGDTVSNDYSVDIPWVNADTYSVTLNYVLAAK